MRSSNEGGGSGPAIWIGVAISLILAAVAVLAGAVVPDALTSADRADGSSARAANGASEGPAGLAVAPTTLRPGSADCQTVRALLDAARYREAERRGREMLAARGAADGDRDPLARADVLDLLSESLRRGGRLAGGEARRLAEESLELRSRALPESDPEIARSLLLCAEIEMMSGRYARALRAIERALALRLDAFGPSSPLYAEALNTLGKRNMLMERLPEARLELERALEIRRRHFGPRHLAVADTLFNLAMQADKSADYPRAKRLFEESLDIRRSLLPAGHPDIASCTCMIGLVYRRSGDLATAEKKLEEALAMRTAWLGPDHPDVGWNLVSLGVLRWIEGDLAEAERLHEHAIAILRPSLGDDLIGSAYNDLALVYSDAGDYSRALALWEKCARIAELRASENENQYFHTGTAVGLANMGGVYLRLGDFDHAASLLEEAIRIKETMLGPRHPNLCSSLAELAECRRGQGRLDEAERLARRALAIERESLGERNPAVAESLTQLALTIAEAGRIDEAIALHRQALEIRIALFGSERHPVAESLTHLGRLLAETSRDAEARPLLERALAIFRKTLGPAHWRVAEGLALLASLDWRNGDADSAVRLALEGEEVLTSQFRRVARGLPEPEALHYESARKSGLDVAFSVLAADSSRRDGAHVERVWDALVRSRAMVLDEMLRRRKATGRSPDAEALAKQLESARVRLATRLVRVTVEAPERRERHLREAEEVEERSVQALLEKDIDFGREERQRTVRLNDLVTSLDEGSALVSFVRYARVDGGRRTRLDDRGEDCYMALVLRKGRKAEIVPLGPADPLDESVESWRRELLSVPRDSGALARYLRAATELRRAVWDPVSSLVGSERRVFLVPDGALHHVNFAALAGDDGRYLIESGPEMHVLSTERDLARAWDEDPPGRGLVVVGGVDFGGSIPGSSPRFSPLPGTLEEAHEVEAAWKKAHPDSKHGDPDEPLTVLSGRAATEQAFRQNARGHKVIHLATHAFFHEAEDARRDGPGPRGAGILLAGRDRATRARVFGFVSGLALSGANERQRSAAEDEAPDDGVLTAEEVAGLDLRGTEWAVLSACSTGEGLVYSGEGVLGLRRAFQIAGVRTLITSLWKVGDHDSRDWIRRLYAARGSGSSTSSAVRIASLEVLDARRRASVSTHPYFWGAFIASGDWR